MAATATLALLCAGPYVIVTPSPPEDPVSVSLGESGPDDDGSSVKGDGWPSGANTSADPGSSPAASITSGKAPIPSGKASVTPGNGWAPSVNASVTENKAPITPGKASINQAESDHPAATMSMVDSPAQRGRIVSPGPGERLPSRVEVTVEAGGLGAGKGLWLVTFDPAAHRYHPESSVMLLHDPGPWTSELRLGGWCTPGEPVRFLLVAVNEEASAALGDLVDRPGSTARSGLAELPRGAVVIDSVSAWRR